MKTYTLHVTGTHCAACKILIEDILMDSTSPSTPSSGPRGSPRIDQDLVKKVNVDLKKETVEIETESEQTPLEIADILTSKIKSHGYILSVELPRVPLGKKDDVIWKAIPIGLGFLVLFFILQKSDILNIGLGSKTTPVTSFIIGLIASVSSCLAIVGGLVLSLSATVSEDSVSDKKNFILFHIGRLVSFALLGGVLGALGQAIGINFTFTAILGIIASLVMLFLGFHLTGIFSKNHLTLSSGIFQKVLSVFRRIEHKMLTPLLVGFGTFFLPCGFTQAMQVASLSSGSFVSGMLIMFAFALGTLPMLALLSFGSASFAHGKHAPLFFKSAGVVVIGLGVFALLSGLVGLGIINPFFSI